MITIRLTTWVNAPVERCFLLATSRRFSPVIRNDVAPQDLQRKELLQCGDLIEWKLGGSEHASRIDVIRQYSYFREVMTAGMFRHFEHDHHFAPMDDGTRMRDEIRFSVRMGPMGKVFGATVLRAMLMRMLITKNTDLKHVAESSEWKSLIESDLIPSDTVIVPETSSRVANMQRFA
jgi:hypothetical protein